MTTTNDRLAEKARELVDQYATASTGIKWTGKGLDNWVIRITQALHSAEKEGVREGMERAAQTAESIKSHSVMIREDHYLHCYYDCVAKAIREEANKEL